jgi:hypothetical protein
MPRVLIRADDGRVFWDERVEAANFASEHYRRCLADRLWWATEDAEATPPAAAEANADRACRHGERRRRRGARSATPSGRARSLARNA